MALTLENNLFFLILAIVAVTPAAAKLCRLLASRLDAKGITPAVLYTARLLLSVPVPVSVHSGSDRKQLHTVSSITSFKGGSYDCTERFFSEKQGRFIHTKKNGIPPQKVGRITIRIFFLLMAVLFITGLLFPLRPSESELEKRSLAEFPAFSFAALWDGSYFEQLSPLVLGHFSRSVNSFSLQKPVWKACTASVRKPSTGMPVRARMKFPLHLTVRLP